MILRPLFRKAWRDHLRGFIGWLIGVVGITVIQLAVYPSVRDSRANWSQVIDQFPEAFQKMFRMTDYTSEVGYLSAELFALTIPLLFIGMAVSWGARATAEDEETGTADILLSLPISRVSVITTRMTAMFSALGALALALVVTLVIGAQILDLGIQLHRYFAASLVMVLIGSFFGLIACVFGALTGRKGAALGYSIGIAIALFVLYSLAPLVDAFNSLLWLNPLQWTIGAQTLSLGFDIPYTIAAVSAGLILATLSALIFGRRDISA